MAELTTLAETINTEHRLAYAAALESLSHAIACGEALIRARPLVPDGEWHRWVETNTEIPLASATRFVRLATYKDLFLEAEHQPRSINAAINYLRDIGVPAAYTGHTGKRPTFDVDEAKRLRELGLTFTEIGPLLGVSDVAVWRQLTPGATRKAEEYTRRARQQRRAGKKALAEQQRADAVADIGGAVAAAYTMLNRCAIELDRAIGKAEDDSVQTRLAAALTHVLKAESAILRALGIKE